MKKLSNINESIWSDLQDRSSGEVTRKEDDVRYMDVEQFWLYLIKNYKEKVYYLDKDKFSREFEKDIAIDPEKDICIFGSYNNGELARIMVVITNRGMVRHDKAKKNMLRASQDKFIWEVRDNERYFVTEQDGTISNKTIVDLIDMFLETHIFESIWSDLQDRSSGEVIRKEDDFTNLKDLVPVDVGTSVLWSSRDLEDNEDNPYFTYEEVENITKKSDWRLPTKEETLELFNNTKLLKNTDDILIIEGTDPNHTELSFYKRGYKLGDSDQLYYESYYCCWTSTKYTGAPEAYFMVSYRQFLGHVPMHKENRICVRLVKDKEKERG